MVSIIARNEPTMNTKPLERFAQQARRQLHAQVGAQLDRVLNTDSADLRAKAGCLSRCSYDAERGFRIEEYLHPLRPVFERWPNAQALELRMMEEILGTKVVRKEIAGGRAGPARVDYEVVTLGKR